MKPFTAGRTIASWLLRIMLVWFIYINFFYTFKEFDFKSRDFYFSSLYVLFGILLFVGGFLRTSSMTVFSGLVIFVVPIIQLIRSFPADFKSSLLLYLIPLSVGFYFFTVG